MSDAEVVRKHARDAVDAVVIELGDTLVQAERDTWTAHAELLLRVGKVKPGRRLRRALRVAIESALAERIAP